jgi:hypothetical protein
MTHLHMSMGATTTERMGHVRLIQLSVVATFILVIFKYQLTH